jgi:hypothetical protein
LTQNCIYDPNLKTLVGNAKFMIKDELDRLNKVQTTSGIRPDYANTVV